MNKLLLCTSIVCLLLSACDDPDIKITTQYITNSDWKNPERRKNMPAWWITKIYPASPDMKPRNDRWKYKKDSLFNFCIAPDTIRRQSDTIYFDRAQPGNKWYRNGSHDKLDSIGELQPNSWYMFRRLAGQTVTYYAYVDNNKKVKIYSTWYLSIVNQ